MVFGFFEKRGSTPPPSDGLEGWKGGMGKYIRTFRHPDIQASGHSGHIYFPLENIYVEHSFTRLKYRPKYNSRNPSVINIL